MSDMRHLLETVTKFAGEPEQKPGDQVRGNEPMPRKGSGKKHPHQGRLVGGESILRELEQQIVEGSVERKLREEFSNTVKSAADKIVAAGTAAKDALGSIIPRPFDEKEVAKDIEQRQAAQPAPKTSWRNTDKKMQEATARIAVSRDPDDPDNYDTIRFHRELPDGSIIDIEPYSGSHNNYYRHITGKEPGQSPTSKAMTDTLVDLMQKPYTPGPVIPEPEILYPQDTIKEPPKTIDDDDSDIVAEWGAAGTAVGPGNDDADPVELAAQRAQQLAGKTDQRNQLLGLVGQVNSARSQLADLNKQFPQGANPVEKAMSMQQQQAQRVQLGRQIEDLMTQVAALRSQA